MRMRKLWTFVLALVLALVAVPFAVGGLAPAIAEPGVSALADIVAPAGPAALTDLVAAVSPASTTYEESQQIAATARSSWTSAPLAGAHLQGRVTEASKDLGARAPAPPARDVSLEPT